MGTNTHKTPDSDVAVHMYGAASADAAGAVLTESGYWVPSRWWTPPLGATSQGPHPENIPSARCCLRDELLRLRLGLEGGVLLVTSGEHSLRALLFTRRASPPVPWS
eukprot:533303-Prorocentrum_minimum.AAC.1